MSREGSYDTLRSDGIWAPPPRQASLQVPGMGAAGRWREPTHPLETADTQMLPPLGPQQHSAVAECLPSGAAAPAPAPLHDNLTPALVLPSAAPPSAYASLWDPLPQQQAAAQLAPAHLQAAQLAALPPAVLAALPPGWQLPTGLAAMATVTAAQAAQQAQARLADQQVLLQQLAVQQQLLAL